jgi:chromate transporter
VEVLSPNESNTKVTVTQLATYFLKLGTIGFGGPIALVENIHTDLIVQKKWFSNDEFNEGLTLAQMAPGPLAVQLGIYLSYLRGGKIGAALSGLAFVFPSLAMVVLFGVLYKHFGSVSWAQHILYGTGAAVIGIIGRSAFMLITQSVSNLQFNSIKENFILWVLFLVSFISTLIFKNIGFEFFLACGLIYMLIKSSYSFKQKRTNSVFVFLPLLVGALNAPLLIEMSIFFLKAGSLVFGSGLAIIPFLHNGVVIEYQWLTESEFVDAVAIGMLTPGPMVVTVGFIGYLIADFPGALIAAAGTFVPCYFFTIIPAPYLKKITKNINIKNFVQGIIIAIIGALVGSIIMMAQKTIVDFYTLAIAVMTLAIVFKFKKIPIPYIMIAAAVLGVIIKS